MVGGNKQHTCATILFCMWSHVDQPGNPSKNGWWLNQNSWIDDRWEWGWRCRRCARARGRPAEGRADALGCPTCSATMRTVCPQPYHSSCATCSRKREVDVALKAAKKRSNALHIVLLRATWGEVRSESFLQIKCSGAQLRGNDQGHGQRQVRRS